MGACPTPLISSETFPLPQKETSLVKSDMQLAGMGWLGAMGWEHSWPGRRISMRDGSRGLASRGSSLGIRFGDGVGVLQVLACALVWVLLAHHVPQDPPSLAHELGLPGGSVQSWPCASSAPHALLGLLSITVSLLGWRRSPAPCRSPALLPDPCCAIGA